MDITVIAGSLAIVVAIALFWWGLTARPSAARSNLLLGLEIGDAHPSSDTSLLGRVGTATRRLLPRALVDGLEVNLVQAGHPYGLDLARMIGVKVTLAVLTGVALLLVVHPVIAIACAAILFFLPDYWVLSTRDQRQAEMQSAIADAVDQLTICVEAGLGFDAALARVAMAGNGPLTDELRRTLSDIQAGVPRPHALRALADRAQIAEIRQLVNALLQAQKHGVPLAETLRTHSAETRMKRKQRTEEKAAKLTVKMLFPIVVCFMPVFLIIAAGPAFLSLDSM